MKNAIGAILLLAGGLVVGSPLEAEEFSGRVLSMTAVTRDDIKGTNATSWKTVPGMVVEFTTTKEGPAVATFCAQAVTQHQQTGIEVRLRESGVGNWDPGEALFDFSTDILPTSRCFSWFAMRPAGTYKVKVQWRLAGAVTVAEAFARSLRVQHEN